MTQKLAIAVILFLFGATLIWGQPAASIGTFMTLTETSSSSSTYTFTMTPSLTGYPSGAGTLPLWVWRVGTGCTGGAITGNISSLGAKLIVLRDGSTNPTSAQCAAGQVLILTYDSTAGKLIILSAGLSSAQVLALWSGTKDSTHCLAGDLTMTACNSTGVGSATNSLDFFAGGFSSVDGGVNTPWNNQSGYATGIYNGFVHIDFAATGSPFLTTFFRWPHNFDKTKAVTAKISGFEVANGSTGNFRINVQVGCYTETSAAINTVPTWGTTLVLNPNVTVGNYMASDNGTVTIPSACDSDVMAQIQITRDNTVAGNDAYPWQFHDLSLTYNVK